MWSYAVRHFSHEYPREKNRRSDDLCILEREKGTKPLAMRAPFGRKCVYKDEKTVLDKMR